MLYLKMSILILFFAIFNQVTISSEPLINIVTEHAPPLAYLDKSDSIIKGTNVELIRAVMKQTGLEYQIKILPWPRALREAKTTANTIIFSIGRTPERENEFIWLDHFFDSNYYLFGLKETSETGEVSLEDIRELPVAVFKDDVAFHYLKNLGFTNTVYVNSYRQMFNLLD